VRTAADTLLAGFQAIARAEALAVVAAKNAAGEGWTDLATLPRNMARQAWADAKREGSLLAGHAMKVGASRYLRTEALEAWQAAHIVRPRPTTTANDNDAPKAQTPAPVPAAETTEQRMLRRLGLAAVGGR
jgi:hypothetical protein